MELSANGRVVQWSISIVAIAVAVLHVSFPKLGIDAVTVTLLLTAAVPWVAPLFRKLKLPGGWEIEFQDFQKATERAQEAGLLAAEASDSNASEFLFAVVGDTDPNLALAGLRIEIERRLVKLAQENGILTQRRGAGALLRSLSDKQVLSREQQGVLADLIGTLNEAVHGADVPPYAYEWAMSVGPRLLRSLDDLVHQVEERQKSGEPYNR